MSPTEVTEFVSGLQGVDRSGLIRILRKMKCDFELDFTNDFLAAASVERIRHIIVGASTHARNIKELTHDCVS